MVYGRMKNNDFDIIIYFIKNIKYIDKNIYYL